MRSGMATSFRMDRALTDFPEPDSPTRATHSPRLILKGDIDRPRRKRRFG